MGSEERRARLADLMGRYLDCARAGDWERAFGFMSDEIVLHVPGRSVEMLVGDERVALIVKERFPRPEGAVEIRRANVYRVRDERIDEVDLRGEPVRGGRAVRG